MSEMYSIQFTRHTRKLVQRAGRFFEDIEELSDAKEPEEEVGFVGSGAGIHHKRHLTIVC